MSPCVNVGTCGRELDVEMTGAPMEDICLGDVIAAPGATFGRCRTCKAERPNELARRLSVRPTRPEVPDMRNTEGLRSKFRVARVDGRDAPGGDKSDARYFVLDYVHDENARAALMLYADLCEDELPELAADLRAQLEATVTRPQGEHVNCEHDQKRDSDRPDMICDRLGYPPEVGDEAWKQVQAARINAPNLETGS